MSTARQATPAAFYCVADERYFLGAVGMINSLRLVGHAEPIYLLDCGLTEQQRQRLAGEANVVSGPRAAPPWLLKTIAPLRNPAEVMILIDADVVATRSLADPIARAAGGRVVAFRNDTDRFLPEWGELLDLGRIRREPYVTSGLVMLGGAEGAQVLELLDDRQQRVDIELGFYGRRVGSYPFLYPEQDVLNAVLCGRPEPSRIVRLENRLAANPPYRGLRVRDSEALRCAYPDGTEPYVLHQFVRKPWLEPTYHSPYSRLLARALLGDDVAIPVDEREVPLRMRDGLIARLERRRVDALDLARWYAGEVISGSLRGRRERPRQGRRGLPREEL
jgi:hypothetical protein